MRPPRAKRRTPARVSANTDEIYRLAFEGASEFLVVIRVSPRGTFHIEHMNPSAVAYFSRTLPEITPADVGRADMATLLRAKARLTREQVDAALTPHREAVRTRGPVSRTSEICTGAGERLTRQFTITPVADRRGRVTRLLYRGTDTTGLRSAEERFERLFELSPVPLSIIRLSDEVRLQANAAWLALHGRTREEAVSRDTPARTVWADPGLRRSMIAKLRRDGSAPGTLARLVTAGGLVRNTIVSMARIAWEGEGCMLVATHDVSDIESARQRLQSILDGAPLAISITRRDSGERVYVNPAWHTVFGEGPLDPGQTAIQGGFWSDAEERHRLLAPLLERGERVQLERRYRRRDGREFELLFTAEPIEFDGQPCILSVSQDVTEMSQARREARVSHERFTKLFELSPVPIVIGRLSDGAYLAANAAWLELHGYRREELDGQTSLTLRAWMSPEDRARVTEILRREGELKAMPVKFRAKSGATIDTLYYATLVEWDGETAIVAAPQDITELVRTRREADTQTERFKALFRLSPSPSSVTTLNDSRYLAVNSSWAAAMGYAPEEMLDRRALDLGIWPDAGERTRFVSELKTRGTLRQMPVSFRTRRGEVRQMQISSELIQWSGVPAILSSMNDVTDITRAGEEIRNLNESLEQKVLERTAELEAANRELESFSYSVSHDLRSPLGAINGFAHVLRMQESSRLSADGDRLLGLLERDAERMALLVDGLLDFSRLGRKPVAKSAVAMAELVAGVADELRGKHDARRAQIRIGPLPACGGDPMLLRQVWWNLLDNALKYSRHRDSPLLEVGHDSAASAYFVRDNGVGFDMRHAGKLFGVFERLHSDSEFEGTGIGLATVARIVLRHGGRIWCDAVSDRGATFYFSLPA